MANNRPYFALNAHRLSSIESEEIENYWKKQAKDHEIPQDNVFDDVRAGLEQRKENMKKGQIDHQLEMLHSHPEQYTALYNIQADINSFATAKDPQTPDSESVTPFKASPIKEDENGNLSMKINSLQPAGISMEIVDGRVQFSPEDMNPEKMMAMVEFLQRHGLTVDVSNLKLENADQKTEELFSESVKAIEEENKYLNSVEGPQIIFGSTESNAEDDENGATEAFENIDKDDRNARAGEVNDTAVDNDEEADDESSANENNELDEEENQNNNENSSETQESEKERKKRLKEEKKLQKAEQKKKEAEKKAKLTKEKAAKQKDLDTINKGLREWMDKNKTRGYSWYEGSCWNGGWKTFTAYPSESTDPLRKPFTVDPKSGEIKCNYEFKIYTRINKNGEIEIAYSLPPGKTLTDDQAYLITSVMKDAGITKVKYGGMSDSNEGVMRTACAKRLMIPVGHKINAERFDKMSEAAAKKADANSPELYRYKYDLAMQIKANWEAKGKDVNAEKNRTNPDCRRIRWAIGAYQLHPFRDLWEDFGLRSKFEEAVAKGTPGMATTDKGETNGASQVIGATMAVVSLYKIYDANAGQSLTVRDLLQGKENLLRNEAEKNALKNSLTGKDSLDTNVRDLSPTAMKGIYAAMCATETEKAKKDIDKRYIEILKNNQDIDGKGESPEKAVSDCLNNARARIEDVNGQLEDCDLKKIYLTRFSLPRHDFTDARAQAEQQGLIIHRGRNNSANSSRTNSSNSPLNNQTRRQTTR